MTRLNSRATLFHKKLFPTIWFGFLLFFLIVAPMSTDEPVKRIIFLVAPIAMAVFGYVLMKKLIFGLADTVFREDDRIICRKGDCEARFNLNEIQSALLHPISAE